MVELCKNHERHDKIIDDLQRNHAGRIGWQILNAYSLPYDHPSIAMYDTPRLHNGMYPDLAALVNTGLGMHLTAIVEVKRTPGDLLGAGPQLSEYIGNTSCFFLAVPSELLGDCIGFIQRPKNLRLRKGIINADNGEIVVLPMLQNHNLFSEAELIHNIGNEARFKADSLGQYRAQDIPVSAAVPSFTEIDGMLVRSKYADVFHAEYAKGYPSAPDYWQRK